MIFGVLKTGGFKQNEPRKRNKAVEADKALETSWVRRIIITI